MQLRESLIKIGIMASVGALSLMMAHASIEDSVTYYDTDDYGNVVYFGSNSPDSYEFIFVDGSSTAGLFSSASIAIIQDTQQAGYAVVPAQTLEQMSRNAQFSKVYNVDCVHQRVESEEGTIMRLLDMNSFHQTSAGMACSILEVE